MRKLVEPTVTDESRAGGGTRKEIRHPAFATVRVSRVSGRASLFDSNTPHDGYITLSFHPATKHEDAYSEHVYASNRTLFQVALAEHQFVAMVTRMNVGGGVPCTLEYAPSGPTEMVPGIATFEDSASKLQRKAVEVADLNAGRIRDDIGKLKELTAKLPQKTQREIANILDHLIDGVNRNMEFGRQTLAEEAEKLVVKAKVEIDAHVSGVVTQLGIDNLQQLSLAAARSSANGDQKLLSDNSQGTAP